MSKFGVVLVPFMLLLPQFGHASAGEVVVAAANSTCTVLTKVAALYESEKGTSVTFICKSSGRLAKGLKGKGIKADVYISASKSWMDKVVKANVVDKDTVKSLWGNSLVAVTSSGDPIKFENWNDLTSDKVGAIMIGDPSTAPFGRYTKQALESTGIWEQVKTKLTTKKHITLLADAMADAEQGTVGILFSTNVNEGMRVVYQIDEAWHKPIRYYASIVRNADNLSQAESFLHFLQQDGARKILLDAGFRL